MSTSWAEALDSFAANLRTARKQLEDGILGEAEPVPLASWPPQNLTNEPLPVELKERGLRLLAESESLQSELRALRDSIPGDPQNRRRSRYPRSRPTSQRFSSDL